VRLARPAIPIAMLCLALAGCGGGSKVTVQEAPGGTAGLKVSGGDQLAPTATATPTASATATTTAAATSTPAASTNTQTQTTQTAPPAQSTPQGTAGGGAAAPTSQATPAPGSDKQKFEAFCQQNPGAC
jgi:hypothetical protein